MRELMLCQNCNFDKSIDQFDNINSGICISCKEFKLNGEWGKYQGIDLGYEALDKKLRSITVFKRKLNRSFQMNLEDALKLVLEGKANVCAPDTIYIHRTNTLTKSKRNVFFAIPIYDLQNRVVDVIENPSVFLMNEVNDQFVITVHMDCSAIHGKIMGLAILFIGQGRITLINKYDRKQINPDYGELFCLELALKMLTRFDYSKKLHNNYKANIYTDHLMHMSHIVGNKISNNKEYRNRFSVIKYLIGLLENKHNVDVNIQYLKNANKNQFHKLTHEKARTIIGLPVI